MNLSLRGRVTWSFIIANLVVLALTFIVFHYLNNLNKDIESITVQSNRVALLTDEIRISAVSLLKYQRRILTKRPSPQEVDKIINLCEGFTSQLYTLDSLYQNPDAKKVVGKMLSYVDSLKITLSKGALFNRDSRGVDIVGNLADKILDSFSEFQDIQYFETVERDKKIKKIIDDTKRHMMIVLIIGFLFTIILALVIPGKIALPFKKIKDAIRELQDCNFDVSIYYSQDDEIGEIAREMNKMIHSFKVFEELRADRINLENRKFDALANLVRRPVLVANANGNLIYLNNQTYSLLQVQSEDVIGKELAETVIPESIVGAFELALKRRSKIENNVVAIPAKHQEEEEPENGEETKEVVEGEVIDAPSGEEEEEKEPEYIYEGYANVIPIRGKESSLDYYLMVLSKEVFT
ncbi:MAG: PAS domain-containing protein [Halobacteriovoraceae bacterium]|nr:PAS domain-containing protein [Halobacteriovoraceae bacterium]